MGALFWSDESQKRTEAMKFNPKEPPNIFPLSELYAKDDQTRSYESPTF